MRIWIPLEEVMEKHVNKPGFAEGMEVARREIDEEIAMYGTIGNPKPTPLAERTRAIFPRRKKRVQPKAEPAFTLQHKRATA